MNVIVVPDASMIVIPLIEKNGHTYLSPSNFSRHDNMDICEGNFSFDKLINHYCSSELPSGIKGRLYLFSRVVEKADAAIVIGKRPKNHARMYDALNDLILFGGNACNNAHSLEVKIVNDLDIPTLKLAYPTNQGQLIDLIDKANYFLRNLDDSQNPDDLTVDLIPKKDKCSYLDVKKILNNLI
jgi:putative methanogenesis marker protein 5